MKANLETEIPEEIEGKLVRRKVFYLNSFFNLRSSAQILQVYERISCGAKEISEGMAMRERVREIVLQEPMEYTLLDLCSGNGLIPIIAIFTLPLKEAIASDKKPHEHNYFLVRNFKYLKLDLYDDKTVRETLQKIRDPIILTSMHPCKALAQKVIEIYQNFTKIRHVILCPCCPGHYTNPKIVEEKEEKFNQNHYDRWALTLNHKLQGIMERDTKMISPRNIFLQKNKDFSGSR